MLKRTVTFVVVVACVALLGAVSPSEAASREFSAGSGGTLVLDLNAGGSVEIEGTGGSKVIIDYEANCDPACNVEIEEHGDRLEITTRFASKLGRKNSEVEFRIRVPRSFNVKLDSTGGGLTIDGVDGTFTGKTKGGPIQLHDVRGEAQLTTMGGRIRLTDSELDGSLKTMGGEVLFENVIGDVRGKTMGGNVRYKNVQRRDGSLGSPLRGGAGLDETRSDTVQISTMGGDIEIEDAPEGADLKTMGGNIEIRDARRFVRAKTMGGDIEIESIDGWVEATTMGGDIEVSVTGHGGDVSLTSMSGEIDVVVPAGFGMELELEIAFTRNSKKEFEIDLPGGPATTVTPDWDHDHGTPRKYIRSSGTMNGGGNVVKIKTINGNIKIREGR